MPRKGPPPLSVEAKPEGVEAIAVVIADLDRIVPSIRQMALSGKLDLSTPIRVDPERMDETAVRFSCDLLTAATLCDVIRANDRKAGDHPTRVWVKRRAWTKLPGTAMLTLIERGAVVLDPEWFGAAGTNGRMESVALPARRVAF